MAQNSNKILLHACCGICSGYPISYLIENGYTPVVYFCNPNLDTKEEFEKRLDAQKKICEHFDTELIVEEYNHDEYLKQVSGLENEPERGKRCDVCIKLRLEKAAQKAAELGIENFTTSLVISPHKNFEKISTLGKSLSDGYLAFNFRKQDGFLKTNNISKELGIYRQNYCGCEFAKPKIKEAI
mgnify:CR=1 FL=1